MDKKQAPFYSVIKSLTFIIRITHGLQVRRKNIPDSRNMFVHRQNRL